MKGDELMLVVEMSMNGYSPWSVEGKRGETDY